MARFEMTAARARLLFELKDGVLFWADNEAVSERMRGKRAGTKERSGAYILVACLGEVYSLAHLRYLIENGRWPKYEDCFGVPSSMLSLVAASKRKRKQSLESGDEYLSDLIEMRVEIMDALIEEKQA